ncbi:hypothetical protein GOODEAATRI_016742, partial [Goodea atripinnis]
PLAYSPVLLGLARREQMPGLLICTQYLRDYCKEAAPAQKKLDAEDIEKMSDSNEDIKNRLSETVRENAKHLLHPYWKVNGQPVPVQQPQLFTGGVMRWYQIEGIEWLRMLWENGINGILADEMGLGKTIQCIAHIAMMVEKKVMGPFLVVAPLSTVPNWISEFKRFTPEISVIIYHGSPPERAKLLKQIRRSQGPLNMIKNLNCRLVRELKMMPADNKLLLTGTPLQNNLAELWSLLNFLLPEVFDDLKRYFSTILTPFLLRRLKSDVTLEVPPKKEIIVYAPLTPKQETLYSAVVSNTIVKVLGQEKDCFQKMLYVSAFYVLKQFNLFPCDQMTSILDILIDYCYLRGFLYSRLDGSMSYTERDENDRCHRIGQTKPVVVYRLVTANTIDQKILERASAKRKLEQMVIHKSEWLTSIRFHLQTHRTSLTFCDALHHREVKSSEGKVISDKDLEILLDRSDLLALKPYIDKMDNCCRARGQPSVNYAETPKSDSCTSVRVMDRLKLVLQYFQSNSESISNGICIILALVSVKLYTSFDFNCPCLPQYNKLYSLGVMIVPPFVLFFLGVLVNRHTGVMMDEWMRPVGNRSKNPAVVK